MLHGFVKVDTCDMDLFLPFSSVCVKIFKKDEHGDFEKSCHGFVNVH